MNGSLLDNCVVSVRRKDTPRRRTQQDINCLWASRIGGRIVGLVHLVGAEDRPVSINLFRVDPEYRHTAILTNLIDRVRDYCGDRGCLTVQLESHVAPQWVLRQFDARGLRRIRRTVSGGLDLIEFRVDPSWSLAASPPQPDDADNDWSAVREALDELVGTGS